MLREAFVDMGLKGWAVALCVLAVTVPTLVVLLWGTMSGNEAQADLILTVGLGITMAVAASKRRAV